MAKKVNRSIQELKKWAKLLTPVKEDGVHPGTLTRKLEPKVNADVELRPDDELSKLEEWGKPVDERELFNSLPEEMQKQIIWERSRSHLPPELPPHLLPKVIADRESLDWHMQMEPNPVDRLDAAIEDLQEAADEHAPLPKPNTITKEHVDAIMRSATVVAETMFDKCTVVNVRLPNGFVLTESSACVDPANYDFKVGKEICLGRIRSRVWELEGYRLQSEVSGE